MKLCPKKYGKHVRVKDLATSVIRPKDQDQRARRDDPRGQGGGQPARAGHQGNPDQASQDPKFSDMNPPTRPGFR